MDIIWKYSSYSLLKFQSTDQDLLALIDQTDDINSFGYKLYIGAQLVSKEDNLSLPQAMEIAESAIEGTQI